MSENLGLPKERDVSLSTIGNLFGHFWIVTKEWGRDWRCRHKFHYWNSLPTAQGQQYLCRNCYKISKTITYE